MADWIVTIPRTESWTKYAQELAAVADGKHALNYRVPHKPKAMCVGDRCFVVWQGRVRGWMTITDIVTHPQGFRCMTTGRFWAPGCYIQRKGRFHPVDGPEMRGFQGVRRFDSALLEVAHVG